MKSDFLLAITQLSAEKNLPKEVVIGAVEAALVSAYRKDNFAPNQNIQVKINQNNGKVEVWAEKAVVEKVADSRREISLDKAHAIKRDAKIGDALLVESTPSNAGRIAAQTAKQVILQRLHEAEYSAVYEEFANKEGDIITGVVQRIEPKQVFVNLGRAEAVLPAPEQVPHERYRVSQRLKVYLVEVARTNKGPKLVVSRSHPNLVRRLFELEIPEVFNGIVEIKSIAREAGFRSKVAVTAKQEGIDPVGCCVGLRGIRIQNIVNELGGEKLDIIPWHPDPATFIANALSPARVLNVELGGEQSARVLVPDRQLSLAIGKEGQNVRLAAKLTGWRIDIKSASEAEAEKLAAKPPAAKAVAPAPPEVAVVGAVAQPVVQAEEAAEEKVPVAEVAAVEPEAVEPIEIEEEVKAEVAPEEVVEEAEPVPAITLEAPEVVFPMAQPKGRPQLRFAEDIFISRPGGKPTGKEKHRKKKAVAPRAGEDSARSRRPSRGDEQADEE
ncbi:MAG: transcription termination/antitermination protein NusA [Chloroflexi bacterium]|nr:transcription termination/antitermination protein NusA [Chloroflexota bacterium]